MDMPDNGMPNSTMASAMMVMKPYIHFTAGDALYFRPWTPTSPGAVFGACFALFVLGILKCLAAAIGRVARLRWTEILNNHGSRRTSSGSVASQANSGGDKEAAFNEEKATEYRSSTSTSPNSRNFDTPFVARIEVQRGLLGAGEATLGYILMLAVMTFNAGFIFSIIIGLGVGELLFGRFGKY